MKIIRLLESKNNSYFFGTLNTHSTGFSAYHLPKTHHFFGQNFDIIEEYSRKLKILSIFINPSLKDKATKQLHMQYENILPYVGSYLTYEEFTKNCPEIDISKNEWYRLNKGQTYQKTKSELKRTYNDQFQKHWDKQRNIAFQLLKNVKE